MVMRVVPLEVRESSAFLRRHRRHFKPLTVHKFSLGCIENGELVAACIAVRDAYDTVDLLYIHGSPEAQHAMCKVGANIAKEMGFSYVRAPNYAVSKAHGWSMDAVSYTHLTLPTKA